MKLKLQVVLLPVSLAEVATEKVTSYRKFLHLADPTNTIGEVCDALVGRYYKLYPDAKELQVEGVQDNDRCDLDPDFCAADVFLSGDTLRILCENLSVESVGTTTILEATTENSISNSLLAVNSYRKRTTPESDLDDSRVSKRSRTIWGVRLASSLFVKHSGQTTDAANDSTIVPQAESPTLLPPPDGDESRSRIIPHKRLSPNSYKGKRITSGMLHAPNGSGNPQVVSNTTITKDVFSDNDETEMSRTNADFSRLVKPVGQTSSEPEEIESGSESDVNVSVRRNVVEPGVNNSINNVVLPPPQAPIGVTPSKKGPLLTLTPAVNKVGGTSILSSSAHIVTSNPAQVNKLQQQRQPLVKNHQQDRQSSSDVQTVDHRSHAKQNAKAKTFAPRNSALNKNAADSIQTGYYGQFRVYPVPQGSIGTTQEKRTQRLAPSSAATGAFPSTAQPNTQPKTSATLPNAIHLSSQAENHIGNSLRQVSTGNRMGQVNQSQAPGESHSLPLTAQFSDVTNQQRLGATFERPINVSGTNVVGTQSKSIPALYGSNPSEDEAVVSSMARANHPALSPNYIKSTSKTTNSSEETSRYGVIPAIWHASNASLRDLQPPPSPNSSSAGLFVPAHVGSFPLSRSLNLATSSSTPAAVSKKDALVDEPSRVSQSAIPPKIGSPITILLASPSNVSLNSGSASIGLQKILNAPLDNEQHLPSSRNIELLQPVLSPNVARDKDFANVPPPISKENEKAKSQVIDLSVYPPSVATDIDNNSVQPQDSTATPRSEVATLSEPTLPPRSVAIPAANQSNNANRSQATSNTTTNQSASVTAQANPGNGLAKKQEVNLSKEDVMTIIRGNMRVSKKINQKLAVQPQSARQRFDEDVKARIRIENNLAESAREIEDRRRAATTVAQSATERSLRSRTNLGGIPSFEINPDAAIEEAREKERDMRASLLPQPFRDFASKSKLSSVFIKFKKLEARIEKEAAERQVEIKSEPGTPKKLSQTPQRTPTKIQDVSTQKLFYNGYSDSSSENGAGGIVDYGNESVSKNILPQANILDASSGSEEERDSSESITGGDDDNDDDDDDDDEEYGVSSKKRRGNNYITPSKKVLRPAYRRRLAKQFEEAEIISLVSTDDENATQSPQRSNNSRVSNETVGNESGDETVDRTIQRAAKRNAKVTVSSSAEENSEDELSGSDKVILEDINSGADAAVVAVLTEHENSGSSTAENSSSVSDPIISEVVVDTRGSSTSIIPQAQSVDVTAPTQTSYLTAAETSPLTQGQAIVDLAANEESVPPTQYTSLEELIVDDNDELATSQRENEGLLRNRRDSVNAKKNDESIGASSKDTGRQSPKIVVESLIDNKAFETPTSIGTVKPQADLKPVPISKPSELAELLDSGSKSDSGSSSESTSASDSSSGSDPSSSSDSEYPSKNSLSGSRVSQEDKEKGPNMIRKSKQTSSPINGAKIALEDNTTASQGDKALISPVISNSTVPQSESPKAQQPLLRLPFEYLLPPSGQAKTASISEKKIELWLEEELKKRQDTKVNNKNVDLSRIEEDEKKRENEHEETMNTAIASDVASKLPLPKNKTVSENEKTGTTALESPVKPSLTACVAASGNSDSDSSSSSSGNSSSSDDSDDESDGSDGSGGSGNDTSGGSGNNSTDGSDSSDDDSDSSNESEDSDKDVKDEKIKTVSKISDEMIKRASQAADEVVKKLINASQELVKKASEDTDKTSKESDSSDDSDDSENSDNSNNSDSSESSSDSDSSESSSDSDEEDANNAVLQNSEKASSDSTLLQKTPQKPETPRSAEVSSGQEQTPVYLSADSTPLPSQMEQKKVARRLLPRRLASNAKVNKSIDPSALLKAKTLEKEKEDSEKEKEDSEKEEKMEKKTPAVGPISTKSKAFTIAKPSLLSLTSLAARGVPDVQDKVSSSQPSSQMGKLVAEPKATAVSRKDSDAESDSSSDSASSSGSDSDSSSDDDSGSDSNGGSTKFVKIQNLRGEKNKSKKKKNMGFSSLMKDVKKK